MTFIKKASLVGRPKVYRNHSAIKIAIANIHKMITKLRTAARRSTNPNYVLPREEKIEKLSLILADLNLIIKTQ